MRNVAPNTRPAPQVPVPPHQALPGNAPPSYPCHQQPYSQVQQNPAYPCSASQGHNHVPSEAVRTSASTVPAQSQLPAGQAHRPSQSNMMPINVPSRSQPPFLMDLQKHPSRSLVSAAAIQLAPDFGFPRHDRFVGPPDQMMRGAEREASHTSNSNRGPYTSRAANNVFQAQVAAHGQTSDRNQRLNMVVQQQNFETQATLGIMESGRTLAEQPLSEPISSDAAFAAADRHASCLLARTYPSLNGFYEVQKRVLRDELLRLNAMNRQTLYELQDARNRATRAEQEAKEKQETALRASGTIVSKALKWKESLEDTRRKYASLQEQHAKLAQIALELNKQAKADSSEALIAALTGRVQYLETRLKKYEDVHPGFSDLNIPIAIKDELDSDTSTSMAVKGFSSPEQEVARVSEDDTDSDKQRLQKIVVDLLERNSSHKTTVDVQSPKKELLVANAEAESRNASYIIDLTTDDPGKDQAQEASLDQTSTTLAKEVHHPLSDSAQNVASSGSGPGQTLSSDSISFKNPLFLSTSDGQKRDLEGADDVSRTRKRVRLDSSTSSRPLPEVVEAPENLAQTQNTRDSDDALSAPFAHPNGLDTTFSNSPDTGKGHSTVQTSSAHGLIEPFIGHDTPLQVDTVHLQLIYHKCQSGATECRFCVMECELDIRDANKKRIFPATTTNDELIDHAVSDHYSIVSHMLQMDRTIILQTFASILEAA
ncbi:hypothetical protein ACEPAI_5075 [Sanghuangporus weigelae]